MNRHGHWMPVFFVTGLLTWPALSAQQSLRTVQVSDWQRQIEADWLRQEVVRKLGPQKDVTTKEDAAGGCDGVKDGKWGFHTGLQDNPWWQVDLGSVQSLARVLIFNRCDCSERASRLILLLSKDGQSWHEVYRHNGTVFYGATDGKPLSVSLKGAEARIVRVQLPGTEFLHFDEVEVYGTDDPAKNLALGQPADQSSVSPWSTRKARIDPKAEPVYPIAEVIERGRRLIEDLRSAGVSVDLFDRALREVAEGERTLRADTSSRARLALYLKARWTVRSLALTNPRVDFDSLLFVKRAPGIFSHMSDQHYGWWSRPGGGVFLLEGLKGDAPHVRCLTGQMPLGSFIGPDLSFDRSKALFAYCRYYPHVATLANKVDKEKLPDDAFYHVFEVKADGTGLRQLTRGRYDDFDPRYLPDGDIVFLSTRRGQFVQCSKANSMTTLKANLPDSYVRCGGDPYRPVAVYTLHVMDSTGGNLRALSPFENFEWTPSVAPDGRVLYARWDYVDRDNMPFMKLWSMHPDGTHPQIVYGNFTRNPYCAFEARSVPDSNKLIFTASAHHSITGGSVVLLDPVRGMEGLEPLTRLTPEVCFPEVEGWPSTYYANPFPLSERYFLAAWSDVPLLGQGLVNPPNAMGLYLCDAFGNLELLYRDREISSMYPIPLRPRMTPPAVASSVDWEGRQEGRLLLLNVYRGLQGIARGAVKSLRIVAMPAKTQPNMNTPSLGVTNDDPGKCVLGTVPVEEDGSASFRVPSGVPLFFQALDRDGMAVQTMRSLTCVQPNQTFSCSGCHEPRNAAPVNGHPIAASRPWSKITVGPEGSWPLRFDRLVQPVLDKHCVSCHRPGSADNAASALDLTPARSYDTLISYGKPSLRDGVLTSYREGKSVPGVGGARTSRLLALLRERGGHHEVRLDSDGFARLVTWMDTYAQRLGSFSEDQEARLTDLRTRMAGLLQE